MLSLLVGIDTEGDNQWSAEARLHQRFENIYALPRLHALFQKHRVRPTYLITWPVARTRAPRPCSGNCGGPGLRDRRASPRVGNAAVHRG